MKAKPRRTPGKIAVIDRGGSVRLKRPMRPLGGSVRPKRLKGPMMIARAVVGLRPSFSAHVRPTARRGRCRERGAPVPFLAICVSG
jgi:hypothetical protein